MSKYRRFNHSDGGLMFATKKTDEGILTVGNNSISLDTILAYDDFYSVENGYLPTTKKVFDEEYNRTMEFLNNLK